MAAWWRASTSDAASRYSARGGPIKGCTATLMFSRNNRKTFPELSWFSGRKISFQNYPKIGP
jgi:hypothetical protein